jgi:hypothetical protein
VHLQSFDTHFLFMIKPRLATGVCFFSSLTKNSCIFLQSFRLGFALVMGALAFMMMSLRQGKSSDCATVMKHTYACPVINLC